MYYREEWWIIRQQPRQQPRPQHHHHHHKDKEPGAFEKFMGFMILLFIIAACSKGCESKADAGRPAPVVCTPSRHLALR